MSPAAARARLDIFPRSKGRGPTEARLRPPISALKANFRARKGAAPLKQRLSYHIHFALFEFPRSKGRGPTEAPCTPPLATTPWIDFRARKGAAPLKRDGGRRERSGGADFRARKGAAPLKLRELFDVLEIRRQISALE